MTNTVLLFINLIIAAIGIVLIILKYRKERDQRDLVKHIFYLSLIIGILNVIKPIIDHFKVEKPPAIEEQVKQIAQKQDRLLDEISRLRDQLQNPTEEEVKSELERELKKAFEEKKQAALKEYHLGYIAYQNNSF